MSSYKRQIKLEQNAIKRTLLYGPITPLLNTKVPHFREAEDVRRTVSWYGQVSKSVSKILMACWFKKTLLLGYVRNADMHSFPLMYIMGGVYLAEVDQKRIFSKKVPKKQRFWGTQIGITWLWRGITPSILKIFYFLRGVSENLGHKLSDEP